VHGPREYIKIIKANPGIIQELRYGSSLPLVDYLTLMLHSRTTEVHVEHAPERLNKRRMEHGKVPLPAHRAVNIVPLSYRTSPRGAGTHASPRLHWRRSHKRHFEERTGGAVWVPAEQWKGKVGWWVTVVPRFLVGKAELGEVSHEYRVHMVKKEKVT